LPGDDFPPDFGLYDEPPRQGRVLLQGLLGFGFVLFVAGGLFAGWSFLANWKVLAGGRPPGAVQVQVPGGLVVSLPEPALPAVPGMPGQEWAPGASTAALPDWTDRERINVLLMGIDHRDDEPIDGSRSDTMMLVSIDPPSKSVLMVSLPRDLWVAIPGYGEQRINVAHMVGGPDLAMRTVSGSLGVKVSHYARIDFRGFEQIVNTLGGVLVDVERPIKDDEYPTEDYGVMRIYIPPGPQWMDGKVALQYARSRHSENDFGRARRQQRLLVAMRERGVQANLIVKGWELLPLAQRTVSTNFGPLELAKLAKLATEIDRERIANLVIDTEYAAPILTADGADVLVPDRGAVQNAINRAFSRIAAAPAAAPNTASGAPSQPAAAPPPITRVEVLNGTSRQGLARATGDWLRQKGYEITRVDSAERADYAQTQVMAQPGREPAATALASALGLPASTAVQLLPAAAGGPDVRLILGQNYQLPTR
jgi:polyisoprenyl-teichoic acid--peptidoglycan teichoic acid transferase